MIQLVLKWSIKICFTFFRFSQMFFELLESRRGDPYTTVDMNCIRFALL